MSEPVTELKDRLRAALDFRGIKPVELSAKTGIPKSAISQYMSGYAKPKQDRIYLLSKALDVNEAWLLGYNVPMEKDKTTLSSTTKESDNIKTIPNQLVRIILSLNDDMRDRLQKYAEALLQLQDDEEFIINAAHSIDGASQEDLEHDDAIMNDENF